MSTNSAQMRVIDASFNTGPVDSYQDNAALAYNLNYGTVTSYVSSVAGSSSFALDRAGTRQALVGSKATLTAGKQYTEIVSGSLVNMQQAVLTDQSTPAPSGQIALRFINEAFNAGAVDVYLVPPQTRVSSLSPVTANLAVGSNLGYINVPSGTYSINVLPAGSTPSAAAKLLGGAQVEYPSGSVRTLVFIDQQTATAKGQPPARYVQAITANDAADAQ